MAIDVNVAFRRDEKEGNEPVPQLGLDERLKL
jgi:hypothetical protein